MTHERVLSARSRGWCARAWLACTVLASALVWSSAAGAQARSLRVHFSWSTPPADGCSTRAQLERGVEALLGRSVFVAREQADAEVEGSLEARDARWVAELALSTRGGASSGRREIVGLGTCAALERALVVVLATLVDAPAPPPMAAETSRGSGVGLAADVGAGTLPDTAIGATLFGEWRPARAWPVLALSVSSWLPHEIRSARGFGGRFWGFRAELAVCPILWEEAGVSFGACAGAAVGGVQGRGLGLAPDRASLRLTAHVPVEATLTIPMLPHLSLRIAAGLSLALLRPAFYFTAADGVRQIVHRLGALAADVRLGFIVDRW